MAPRRDAVLIDAQIITDPDVSPGLLRAFALMALYMRDDMLITASVTGLSRAAGISRQGMGKHLKDLAALGYLRVEQRGNGRAQRVWIV